MDTTTRKILYSPGFGAGWYTWNREMADAFLFDAGIIEALENGTPLGAEDDSTTPLGAFRARLVARYGERGENAYLGGARDLRVTTVEGQFYVDEYDGSESIVRPEDLRWI